MQPSIRQGHYLLSLADPILAGLGDLHLALEPEPGAKTAGWIIGHLAVTADFARRLCGRSPMCPAEWRALFNPGTQPSHDPSAYPPMATLCDALRRTHADLLNAGTVAGPELLAAANPYAPGRDAFPTAGDFAAYIMSSHLAYHLGQLVAWRAAAGIGRLPRPDELAA